MNEKDKPGLDASYGSGSAEENRRVYRDWAATYDEEFAGRSGYRFGGLIAEAFVDAGGSGPVLDAGCGTGLVADRLPAAIVVDGVDLSPDMLAVAEDKGRYRTLVEADLTKPLPFEDDAYNGLTCAGTFTQGHVGPEALAELLRVLRPGAICAISVRLPFYDTAGFAAAFEALAAGKRISRPSIRVERVYSADSTPPEGHENDLAYIVTFRKT
ncbi:MAG: class I SAM-dependent methyltransferase [Rhodospirillaceae bacterium]|nr:class I SAM-dependent methyltransferase [Rhodospirillaceae bacterium]